MLEVVEDAAGISLPFTDRVTIMDLSPGVCRWPIGDPQKDDFSFCGATCRVDKPYCAQHRVLAYAPPQPKKKVAWRAHR